MRRQKKWFWGVFFVLAAVLIILNQVSGLMNATWLQIGAAVLLVAIFIQALMEWEFFGMFISAGIFAIVFATPLGIGAISPWAIIAAAVFAGIGCSILFHKRRPKKEEYVQYETHASRYQEVDENNENAFYEETVFESEDGEEVEASVSFGATAKYLDSKNLKKAYFDCSFGELKIYFDNVALSNGAAEIKVKCSFGSMVLYIPRGWVVVDSISVSMGDVSEKNNHNRIVDGKNQLTISGKVTCGSIDIVYI